MQVTVVNESLLLTADDLEEETMFSSLGACGPTVERLLLDPTRNALVPFTEEAI